MTDAPKLGRWCFAFRTDRRAGVAVFIALLFPAIIAMGLLAVDAVRAFSQATLVSSATQAAALAGGMNIGSYYSQGATNGGNSISQKAALIGDANAASSTDLSSVIQQTQLGNWNPATSPPFIPLATSGTTLPNAVQVTGTLTTPTYFGGAFGTPTLSITKTATATLASNKVYNVIVLNDMGGPNNSESLGIPGSAQWLWWNAQQAADLAIMRCLQATGNTSSKFGVTGFVQQAFTLQAMTTVNSGTNATTIATNIASSTFQFCRQNKNPYNCHGSNVAAAIYSAIAQFQGITTSGASNHIIILTNELPIYDPAAAIGQTTASPFTTAMGTGVTVGPGVGPDGVTLAGTGSSATALCSGIAGCTTTNLKQMAEAQAAAAGLATGSGGLGLTVSVIYFSGDNSSPGSATNLVKTSPQYGQTIQAAAPTPPGMAAAYWTEISSWVQNNGMALQTSVLNDTTVGTTTTPGVATQAGKFCQQVGSTLRSASP